MKTRSVPLLTVGFRPGLNSIKKFVGQFDLGSLEKAFTRAAREGTSAGFFRAGISIAFASAPAFLSVVDGVLSSVFAVEPNYSGERSKREELFKRSTPED
jgi:hypothetical protein